MVRLFGAILAGWVALSAAVAAQDSPVVVELFTSQGCSSCPPADGLFAELAARDDIVALAFHVDYWDYIGWKDIFASPAHTARQKGYARAAGKKMIYTPQMVVGGVDHVVGVEPMALADLIRRHAETPRPVEITVSRAGEQITVEARAVGAFEGPALVQVFRFRPKETVAIRRGENAGRTLDYHNIVEAMAEAGRWNGRGVFRASVRVPGAGPVAVVVQEADYGPVLAAAVAR